MPYHTRTLTRLFKWGVILVGWSIALVLAWFFVRRDAFKYVEWSPEVYRRFWPTRHLLAIHVAASALALIAGPLQFVGPLRRQWPRFHRTLGWIYVVAVLGSIPTALRLSLFTNCALCVSPFVVWSATTLVVTLIAVILAVLGRHGSHRDFMIRSYALMYAFVLVRLDAHLIGTPLEIPLADGVARQSMVLWLAWIIPLLVAELYVSWIPALRKGFAMHARRRSRSSA